MVVCLECGVNLEILSGHHAPGCSQYEDFEYTEEDLESVASTSHQRLVLLIEAAEKRAEKMTTAIIRGSADGQEEQDRAEALVLDEGMMEVVALACWSGVMACLQVLSEQDVLDTDSLNDYLDSDPDDFEW